MKKKFLIILFAILICTGCWDRTELNEVAIVTGIALDPGEDKKFRVTVGIVNSSQFTKQGGGDSAPVTIFSLEGNTLAELTNKMNVGVPRRLVYSHTRVLYISEEIARKGIISFLDFLERSGEFRNDFNILVAKGNKAESFIKINNPIEKIPSVKVQKQIDSFKEDWGGDPGVRLTDFISSIVSKGRAPVVNSVIIEGDVKKGEKIENNQSSEQAAKVLLNGLSVLKDGKLVGFLTLEETRDYFWTQELKSTSITMPCHNHKGGKEDQFIDLRIYNSTTDVSAYYKNNRPVLEVEIHSEAELEGMQCPDDMTKIDTYKKFEEKAGEFIKNNVVTTIKKVQDEYKTDIFGFGEALNRKHYKKFKEVENHWDEEFTRGDVKVSVDFYLRRSGTRNKSFLTDIPKGIVEE